MDQLAEFADPDPVEKTGLNVLVISEAGTMGLVGREAVTNEQEEKR